MKSSLMRFAILVSAALLTLLGFHREPFRDSVWLLSCEPMNSTISEIWRVPLARFPEWVEYFQLPYPIYATVAAWIIGWTVFRGTERPVLLSVLTSMGLAACIAPHDLIPGILLGLHFRSGRAGRSWRLLALWIVSCGVTRECGLLGLAGLAGLANSAGGLRPHWRMLLIWVMLAGTASWMFPGFSAMLCRPGLALTINTPPGLIPSLESWGVWRSNSSAMIFLVPVLTLTFCQLWQIPAILDFACGCFCVLLILLVPAYLCLALWMLVLLTNDGKISIPDPWPARAIPIGLLIGAGFWAAIEAISRPKPTFTQPRVELHPEMWDTGGPTVLMNLDWSERWQLPAMASRYELVVDRRWESMGSHYREFAELCRDLREGREHRYLRGDLSWGGYKLWMKDQPIALIVIDILDLDAMRWLPLSPDWRLLGLDPHHVIFGNAALTSNRPLIRQTAETLLRLEWDGEFPNPQPENTLQIDRDHPSSMARAICAMRFPFAALRILENVPRESNPTERASCYVELSHRVAGLSAAGSLLDQWRAHSWIRKSQERTPEIDSISLNRGIAALSEILPPPSNPKTAEERLRLALLNGNEQAVRDELPSLSPEIRQYFEVLIHSPDLTARQLVEELRKSIDGMREVVTPQTLSEAFFYLGCAAIEAGDPRRAIDSLRTSEDLASRSPFNQIRNLYLRQLTRKR